ncbi:MAG: hypothetical protein IJY38_00830 [Clostridia bacterium]|nr:hypothetical protein [Clostridia bacterium]
MKNSEKAFDIFLLSGYNERKLKNAMKKLAFFKTSFQRALLMGCKAAQGRKNCRFALEQRWGSGFIRA